MQWKVLVAVGGAFTVLFASIAIWILRFSTDSASDRVRESLRSTAVGGAATIDAAGLAALVAGASSPAPPAADVYPDDAGSLAGETRVATSEWPTDPRYWAHVNELVDIRLTNPEASPYTFVVGNDGEIRFIGSWGAAGYPTSGDPPDGARYLQRAREIVPASTLAYFARGAGATTEQPAYTDEYGSWISAYTPIVDAAGTTVGVLGVDYPLDYVEEVRGDVLRVLYPFFAGAYVVLLLVAFALSRSLTRRVARLSAVTTLVADGNYDVDVSAAARSRFPDEMTELAEAFRVMAAKVGARERDLVQQVQVLKVEIDDAKRRQAVAEITDSDFFSTLAASAATLRAKVRGAPEDLDRSSENGEDDGR